MGTVKGSERSLSPDGNISIRWQSDPQFLALIMLNANNAMLRESGVAISYSNT